ncbi:HNH endonuclease signature motif containing protein [Clostridium intestinale]|nr:HNH endonuclease signature motif containing protein [Clostridium intestinale]
MGRVKGTKNTTMHVWSEEEKHYLKEITPGHHYKEIVELMNNKFTYQFTSGQIKGAIKRYKLNTGFDGQFPKGHVPRNKGIIYDSTKRTWFKKGHIPMNYRPVGSERITADGYTEIKVADPNKWEQKHRYLYKKYHGKIPKNYVVIFADSNKQNFDIDNLILVSRKQLVTLNTNGLIQNDAELTKTGIIIADIYLKIGEKKKQL